MFKKLRLGIDRLGDLRMQKVLLLVMITFYISLFSFLSLSQFDGLKTQMNDLGNMDQPIYNTTKGDFMFSSNYIVSEDYELSRFGIHANFILLLFVPLYFLWSSPKLLLLIQTLVIGAGAIPLFLLSRKILKYKEYALVLPLLYLVNPFVQDVNLYDFHPLAIAMPGILFAFYFMHTKKIGWFYFFLGVLLAIKEDMALIVAMFGVYLFFGKADKKRGVFVAALGLMYFLVVLKIVMPFFAGSAGLVIFSDRYGYLGGDIFEIVRNVFLKPTLFMRSVLSLGKIMYILFLTLPTLFLPFLSPGVFLISLPTILINTLSENPIMYYPFQFYYSAPILAGIFLASVFSLNKVFIWLNEKQAAGRIVFGLTAFSILFSLFLSPAPYSLVSSWKDYGVTKHDRRINEIFSHLPGEASVSVQNNLGSHFSHRKYIYTFPYNSGSADYVLLDTSDPYVEPKFVPRHRSFMFITQFYIEDYLERAREVFDNTDYGLIYYSGDGYYLFEKGAAREKNQEAKAVFEGELGGLKKKYEEIETSFFKKKNL